VVDAIGRDLAVGGTEELGDLVDVPLRVRRRLALVLKPPLIITNRFTSSGRCIATSIATMAPSLWPTRSAGCPTTASGTRSCRRSSAG